MLGARCRPICIFWMTTRTVLGQHIKDLPSVRLYSSSPEDIGEMMEDMEATVEEQYTPGSEDSAVPAVLLINDRNAAAYISEDRELLECYKRLITNAEVQTPA